MNNRKTPRIRFKGFTDDWEQRKLSELVAKYEDPVETPHGGYIRLGIRSHAKGTFHEYVEPGHELETAKMHRVATNKLIFNITFAWEHAVAIANENDAGKLVSHRFPQFTLLESLRPEFLKYVILDEGFHHNLYLASPGGAGRNRVLKIEEALDYPIYYPSLEEQHKIGGLLNKLNDLITLHQRKLEKLKIVKKAMLENCFPKNGEKVPRFRFSGFTCDWEQRKLSELVAKYEDPVETPHGGYIRLGIRSHAKGTFHEYVEPGHELETAKMHRVATNKLIFNITFAWEHAVAIANENDAGKLVSHRFPQFTLLESLRPEFLKYVILDEGFHHNLYLASPGGAGRNRVLKIEEALDYPIYYPSLEEQHKIGGLLNKLNDLITLHQRKLEKLKIIKKSFLEKMFV